MKTYFAEGRNNYGRDVVELSGTDDPPKLWEMAAEAFWPRGMKVARIWHASGDGKITFVRCNPQAAP